MKAIVYRQYGDPDVLHIGEIKKPAPKHNEILISVRAAEATKADCELRSFNFPVNWFWLPLRLAMGVTKPRKPVLGGYFSGVVEAIGKDVVKFKPGDEVFGATQFSLGAYAEYLCLPDSYTVVEKPHNVSFEAAAAVPLGGLNALHFMRKADIKQGEKVLINGAGGSIGTFAVQIAKAMGAQVTAVDSAIKEDMLRRIGADHYIDYAKEDFAKTGQTYDVIFNMVARSSYSKSVAALNPKGRYLMGNPRVSDMIRSVFTSTFTDKKSTIALAGETEAELLSLKEMMESGKIVSAIDQVFTPEFAPDAHRRVETEQRVGIVVIKMKMP